MDLNITVLIHLVFTSVLLVGLLFFFNDTATTEIYTLSLHERSSDLARVQLTAVFRHETDSARNACRKLDAGSGVLLQNRTSVDRKSTRLNSSHVEISYAVFCLKKKTTDTDCFFNITNLTYLSTDIIP